jgi:hypothetical protein
VDGVSSLTRKQVAISGTFQKFTTLLAQSKSMPGAINKLPISNTKTDLLKCLTEPEQRQKCASRKTSIIVTGLVGVSSLMRKQVAISGTFQKFITLLVQSKSMPGVINKLKVSEPMKPHLFQWLT